MIDKNKYFDIPGYEGLYQITVPEKVKSVQKWVYNPLHGQILRKEREMKVHINNEGYKCVHVSKNGKSGFIKIHRILALIFIPNPYAYPCVRHLDDNKLNNSLSNLAWGTVGDNVRDMFRNGKNITLKGSEHPLHGKLGEKHHCYGLRGEKSAHSRILLDTMTGIFYFGAKEAAMAKGINHNTLKARLAGKLLNSTGIIKV